MSKIAINFEKIFRKQDNRNPRFSKIFIEPKYLINAKNINNYLIYPNMWGLPNAQLSNSNYINASLNIGFSRNYIYKKGSGEMIISIRTPFVGSDYNYSWLNVNSINKINLYKFEIKSRVYFQWILGSSIPQESMLMLAGANTETMIENKYTRAVGFVPDQFRGFGNETNHFHAGGGLGLRGYAGYWAYHQVGEMLHKTHFGRGGASYNLELDFDKFIKIPARGITKNIKADTYLFSDLGVMAFDHQNKAMLGAFRANAGLGTAITIKFSPLDIRPLVIRFDMPLWLNTPPADEDFFQFRYVIGVNRAF